MFHRSLKLLALGTALAIPLVALAALDAPTPPTPPSPPEPPHGGMFRMADANDDGIVTRAEFEAMAREHFDRVDTNHDGQVTREEADAVREKMAAAMRGHMGGRMKGRMEGAVMERLRGADKDGNGEISAAEAKALPMLAEHFDLLDADHNGSLTREELRAMRGKHRAR